MNDYLRDNRPLPDAWLGARKPYCRRAEKDCAALSKSGRCNALCNAKFGKKPCPFYKTKEQQKVEHTMRPMKGSLCWSAMTCWRPTARKKISGIRKKENEKPSDLMTSQGY